MRRTLVTAALASLALAGCADGASVEGDPAERREVASWSAPSDYRFQLRSSCGERTVIGRYRIVVRGGEVVRARGLDMSARVVARSEELSQEIPTLDQLLDEAEDAHLAGADVADVRYDETDGHPTSIEIDYNRQATDDEACYEITRYKPNLSK